MSPATSARHLSIVRPRIAWPPTRIRGLRGASFVKSLPAIFFFILYVFRIVRGVRSPDRNLSAFPIIVALPNLYLSAMRAEYVSTLIRKIFCRSLLVLFCIARVDAQAAQVAVPP